MNKKRKTKKRIIIFSIIALIIVGGIIGIIAKKKHSDSLVKVVSITELSQTFSSENLGKFFIYGNLKEGSVQKLNVKEDLEIKEIKVKEGDIVNKGDVLVEYNTDSLNLSLAQCQTTLSILTNSIKIAENELVILKGLIPAEDASVQEPTIELLPTVECEKHITTQTLPLTGDGSENSPFVFNVTPDCVVAKEYMQFLAGDKVEPATSATESTQPTKANSKSAIFHIYNNDSVMLYSWLVDGAALAENDIEDWRCDSGVIITEYGDIQIAQGSNLFATLVTNGNFLQNSEMPDFDELLENLPQENIGDEENFDSGISADDNYVFTKAEIQEMISAKNEEISELKFSMRQAEIDLKQAEKTFNVGTENANISGKVTFVAKSEKEALEKGSYITIVNDTATSVVSAVSENDLLSIEIGAEITAINENTNDKVTGRVTDIADEISTSISEDVFGVYDDTVAYYDVTFELDEKLDVKTSDSVLISINTNTDENAFYLQTMFLRTENGKHYVMVANENNVLEKRYVTTGQNYFSIACQIIDGITEEDRIALPYGRAVEGAPTTDATYEQLFSGYLF